MKRTLLAYFVLSAAVLGQTVPVPQPSPDARRTIRVRNSTGSTSGSETTTLPENYIVTLSVTPKDKPASEISLVAASTNFTVATPGLTFQGSLTAEEDGSFVLQYALNITIVDPAAAPNTPQPTVSTTAAVRLRPDEPIQIYKSDDRSYKLALTRVADQGKKK